MRTLQEKYNAIQEGKFSKENFLADARKELPNLVTRFNGYDDAVQILKNRGMIQEEAQKELATISHIKKLVQAAKTGNKSKKDILAGFAGADINCKVTAAEPDVIKWHYDKYGANLSGEIKLKPQQLEEARLTKNSLTDYRYKPTNDMDKYPYEQILRGLRVELEGLGVHGTPTAEEYAKALSKVSKNLAKDSIYYTNQVAGVNPNVDQHDQMTPATTKNTVDTFNGMKKAELKEGFKKLIKKVLSESMSDVEDYKDEDEMYEMQDPKSDIDFRNELEAYLEDNQIYGYTRKIHDIMTQEDPIQAAGDLALFLDDNQIYGYNRGIEAIYAEYPYEDMYENYEGDEADDISHPKGYEEATDAETEEDLYETRKAKPLSELLK
jgi:hypothetical protein